MALNGNGEVMGKLREKIPAWAETSVADRIDQCISMLFIHGYIPTSVRDKAVAKLKKSWEVEGK